MLKTILVLSILNMVGIIGIGYIIFKQTTELDEDYRMDEVESKLFLLEKKIGDLINRFDALEEFIVVQRLVQEEEQYNTQYIEPKEEPEMDIKKEAKEKRRSVKELELMRSLKKHGKR